MHETLFYKILIASKNINMLVQTDYCQNAFQFSLNIYLISNYLMHSNILKQDPAVVAWR